MTPEREKLIRETWDRVKGRAFRDGDSVYRLAVHPRVSISELMASAKNPIDAEEEIDFLIFCLDLGRPGAVTCEGLVVEHYLAARR